MIRIAQLRDQETEQRERVKGDRSKQDCRKGLSRSLVQYLYLANSWQRNKPREKV